MVFDIKEVEKEAKKYFENANGCRAWDHTQRVINNCFYLGKKLGADMQILELAAILHDIKRPEEMQVKGNFCHAEEGAQEAQKILKNFNLSDDLIQKVCHAIRAHRKRNSIVPQTLEAKILYDADKLDAIGAVGIGRAFMFASKVGAYLHNKNIDLESTQTYSKDDCAYREFLEKLRFLKDKMLTNEGKKLAIKRHEFMVNFFHRLNDEVDGLC
jgi:uncharacterized protein